ncbi:MULTISPECIES: ABC transporter permease [unclassified Haematospirillum]|uniref:ABC transporter permease n=1 Tax=unclassified Haematospirillum TaxID=2622088 RepID=UPI0014392157|nr:MULTISPECIES: ABC transporter permease [unclassified Haematospirillum]NKD54143.1 ABC transporter permease [Haematospirillum sp. H4890]NKD74188.1 ABC transporter permease [Haematospirillum sp. H4485]NKD87143.1 ABC transporter permease [Haematospirillum sp. 15-248]
MSLISFLGSVEIGLVYGLVALGVYLSFRVLNFPDLTVDGSFTLGAAVSAALIVQEVDPYLSCLAAVAAGALAGSATAFLNIRFGILHLLASILVMTALYTINLRIMGRPNIALIMEPTVLDPLENLRIAPHWIKVMAAGGVAIGAAVCLARFLNSCIGIAMRAVGSNERMARANGISCSRKIYMGMAMSNGLVAMAGALFAQMNGFADSTMGLGTIIIGLAAVIIGENLFPSRIILASTLACLVGSVLYRISIGIALHADFIGLTASDLNLITAILVGLALILPRLRRESAARRARIHQTSSAPSTSL